MTGQAWKIDVKDGSYQIEVELSGGSGRANVTSPTKLEVQDGEGTAEIEWSSSHYDYMIVEEEVFYPVNTEGNSVFEIPVDALDQELMVIADTTAMSVPHEISYTLYFDSKTLTGKESAKPSVYGGILIWFLFILLLMLSGCKGNTEQEEIRGEQLSKELIYEGETSLTYATEFSIDEYEGGYRLLSIKEDGSYLVVPKGKSVPSDLPKTVTVLKQPLSHIYLVATAVMDMFQSLDAVDQIRFSSQQKEGWRIRKAVEAMEKGDLIYAGKYSAPDYELLLSENCSLAIENTMIYHSPEIYEKLQSFGIPTLVDHSSYESHPLGRVEWVKLYGALTGKEEEALEAFQIQEEAFQQIEQKKKTGKTVAFFYLTSNGAVQIRKASDYVPKMIALAGGEYCPNQQKEEESKASSMSIQLEEFYVSARDVDFLIYNGTVDGGIASIENLIEKNALFREFKAVQNKQVYEASEDIYQHSMSIGMMIRDLYLMMNGSEEDQEEMIYLKRVE